jgi:hypothetical protein
MAKSTKPRPSRRVGAKLLQCFGAVLVAIATITLLSVLSLHEAFGWRMVGVLLAIALGIPGGLAYRFGASYSARSAAALTSIDSRPPVIYLRSFQDDPVAAKGFTPHSALPFLEFANTEEEDLAGVMNEIGPFVAIGRPGERLPRTGAARMYVTDAEWRERVLQLISSARLVVIRAGYTNGLWWEVETAVKTVKAEKLIFLLPFTAKQYEAFRLKANNYLPCSLPDYRPMNKRMLEIGSVRGFLYFEPNWTPHYLELKPLKVGSLRPLARIFKLTLEPVFRQLNVPWKAPANWYIFLLLIVSPFAIAFLSLIMFAWVLKLLRFLGLRF